MVLLMLGLFGWGLLELYITMDKRGIEDECPSFDSFDSFPFTCYLYQYATTITITSANLLLPFIFSYIIEYEEYNPKTKMIVDITRSIMIRLSGLLVMIYGLLDRNKYEIMNTVHVIIL